MSDVGPFTRAELDVMRALAELHKESSPPARETLRLLQMLDARNTHIRVLCAELDRVCAELDRLKTGVAETLKGMDAI